MATIFSITTFLRPRVEFLIIAAALFKIGGNFFRSRRPIRIKTTFKYQDHNHIFKDRPAHFFVFSTNFSTFLFRQEIFFLFSHFLISSILTRSLSKTKTPQKNQGDFFRSWWYFLRSRWALFSFSIGASFRAWTFKILVKFLIKTKFNFLTFQYFSRSHPFSRSCHFFIFPVVIYWKTEITFYQDLLSYKNQPPL